MPRRTRRPLAFLVVTLATALAGCGDGKTTGPGSQGTLTLSIGSPVLILNPGAAGTVTLTITRGGGFDGTVSLSASGLPAGVTAGFVPASLPSGAATSTLTLTAGPTASAGVATVTITAAGSGVTSQTGTVVVSVLQSTIGLGLNPGALSIAPGQSGTTTVSITRSAGFTGAVTLALDAPPAGITGTFAASPTTAATASLTVNVAGTVAAGQYTVNIEGSATGVADQTVPLTVTVAVAGPTGFTIAVDPVEFELPAGQGWSTSGVVSIERTNGFTGPVTMTVQGLGFPAVVVATPATVVANASASNLLALAIDGAAPGLYTGTVTASAAGFADQTAPVRFRVTAPSTGGVTWTYCRGDRVPRYFALRDGTGPWRHIVPAGPAAATAATPTTFSFDIGQPTASVALVRLGEKTSASPLIEGYHWNVYYLTRQEILDLAAEECVESRDVTTRVASGSVTGYESFDAIIASVGRRGLAFLGSTGPLSTTLTMQNLAPGPFDLLLSRTNFKTGPGPDVTVQSLVLRRGIDPASGATIPAIDFATEAVAAASAPLTFTNTNGETVTNTMTFRTADGLNAWLAVGGAFTGTARVWYGVPNNLLLPGDLHQITATTGSTVARRQIIHFAQQVSPRALDFGPPLATPLVAPEPGLPWILGASGALGPDYDARVSVYYRETIDDPRTMTIVASRGFLGGASTYDVRVPDLAGLPGFTAFWNFRRGSPVSWVVTGGEGGTGDLLFDSSCTLTGYCPVEPVDGATYKSAQATGTVTVP